MRLAGISCFCIAAAFAQTTTYTITTLAGNGTVPGGWTGDAGPATSAELNVPTAAVIDSKGNLYIADSANHRVRYVTGGTITTAAGIGIAGFFGDTGTAGADGKAGDAELNTPSGVVLDSSGNLYIADTVNNVIRMVTPGGVISTVVGVNGYTGNSFNGDGGPATLASLSKPSAMLYDSAGNFYIVDTNNNAIRKVTAKTGIITTVAGTGDPTGLYNGDNGPAVKATLNHPVGIALDASGNLYIADTGNHVIRKVTYPSGTITTVVGNGTPGYAGDGKKVSSATELNSPKGVAVDSAGNIYIADTTNSRIRMIGTDNTITTIAGTGGFGYSGDNGPATSAFLNFPSQISIDSKGNIYVADTNNNVIRLLTPSSPSGGGGGVLPAIRATQGVITAGAFGASSSVAPGTWVEIYGSNLAADTRSWSGDDFLNGGQNAPVSLDRTSVTISGQQTYIDYISPTQVNALLPLVSSGSQQLTITTAAGNSASYPVNVSANQFAVYAPPQFVVGGNQYVGAIFNDATYVMPPNAVSGFTSRQAHPGETITIFGIGFGPASNGLQPGQLSAGQVAIKGTIQVLFGTAPAVVSFAGLAPGTFGLYQLNVVVPAIPSSDQVPLTITLNGAKGTQTLYTAVQ
ncbi:MAG: hypothetical protein P4L56_01510 [Candidatus Sulfopaludibacter sp.]|nr:hypothetical protein [Candidatus Sulfopaludibacter sp.]